MVDAHGGVDVAGRGWRLDWWIGADDRWRLPGDEIAVRQELVASMPVVRTAVRIPDGDAVQRVFGVADGSIVVEVENASPAPFALALVVSGAHRVEVEGASVLVDGEPAFATARPPQRWAVATDGSTRDAVLAGEARDGAFTAVRDRRGRIEAAFLHPVAHRATFRAVLLRAEAGDGDGRARPGADDVARGWRAQLDRGMRVEMADPSLDAALTRARGQAALRAGMTSDAELLGALEDWGLDDEATLAWSRASLRARRRARRRRPIADRWPEPGDDARFLRAVRDVVAREAGRKVDVLRDLPPEWRGADLEVRDVPLRRGRLSYAVRWHGHRPALLWEMPPGTVLRAPGLDERWSTMATSGEALLAAPGGSPISNEGRARS